MCVCVCEQIYFLHAFNGERRFSHLIKSKTAKKKSQRNVAKKGNQAPTQANKYSYKHMYVCVCLYAKAEEAN